MSEAKKTSPQNIHSENALSAFQFEENPAGLIREMFLGVKGVDDCKVCIPFNNKPSDKAFSEDCRHCMFSENPMVFTCILHEKSEFKTLVISTASKKYGHIALKINSEFSTDTMPLLQHLANTAALAMENQMQKKLFEKMNFSSKQYNDKLIAQNNVKDKLISIIAHDLKSPFTALLTSCELLRHQLFSFDMEKIKKHSDAIYDSSKSAYKLLNDLLSWSRLHSGHIKVNKDKIMLYDRIQEILMGLKEAANEKEIEIKIKGDRESAGFFDNEMFKAMIRNLVNNAIKFSYRQGVVNISIIDMDEKKYKISIADKGVGISEENLKKILLGENCETTRGTLGEKGNGLGVLLCKDFAEKNDSEIIAESVECKGSVFSFYVEKYIGQKKTGCHKKKSQVTEQTVS